MNPWLFRISYGTYHWLPFTTICGLCHVDYNFVGTVETIEADADAIRKKFPEKLGNISGILNSRTNSHRPKNFGLSGRLFSQLPSDLILKLYESYESDFSIGGYPFPIDYFRVSASWWRKCERNLKTWVEKNILCKMGFEPILSCLNDQSWVRMPTQWDLTSAVKMFWKGHRLWQEVYEVNRLRGIGFESRQSHKPRRCRNS